MNAELGVAESSQDVKKCKISVSGAEKLHQTLNLYNKVKNQVIQLCTCMTESEFNWGIALEFAGKFVYKNTGLHLKDIEIIVLQSSWEGITYPQTADDYGYSAEYLNKDVGNTI